MIAERREVFRKAVYARFVGALSMHKPKHLQIMGVMMLSCLSFHHRLRT